MNRSIGLDVRHGARILLKRPAFTLSAVLTLALGIGANTAIFSTVSGLLLHPHAFPDLDRLVLVDESNRSEFENERFAPADYLDLKREKDLFGEVASARFVDYNLTTGVEGQVVEGYEVSANFFSMLGAKPEHGRAFLEGEDEAGRERVAVLTHSFWERRLGSDPGLVGRTIQLDGQAYSVVGIMPKDFGYPLGAELWTPLVLGRAEVAERNIRGFKVIGRLRTGESVAQSRVGVQAFLARESEVHPEVRGRRSRVELLREEQYEYAAPLFLTVQGAACFVLLLASVNVGNLLLARQMSRQKEMAIRSALGASRGRHVQLLLTESLVLTSLAAGVGVLGALWGVEVIRASMPVEMARWIAGWNSIRVDGLVLGMTLVVTLLLAGVLGVGAAFQTSRKDLTRALREGGRTSSGGRNRMQRVFVVSEVALAAILLVGAGLMIRGFVRLTSALQSFEPAHILTMKIALPEARYPADADVNRFYEGLLRGLSLLPGVDSAAVVRNLPATSEENERRPFTRENHPVLSPSEVPIAEVQTVSPACLRSLHIPLLRGRPFSDQDGPGGPRVVLLSQALARRFFPGEEPIGERLQLGPPGAAGPFWTVVGVTGDIRQNWWNREPAPALYLPYLQAPERAMDLVLRTGGAPMSLVADVRAVVKGLDQDAPVREIQTMEAAITDSIAPVRIIGLLMLVFGILALALAGVGIYGVLAQRVAGMAHELGVRMALGAQKGDVLRLVLWQALGLALAGLALGLPFSFALSHVMASNLFGVVSVEPGLLVGLSAVLIAMALFAGYVPARRATRVDPVGSLREE
jgi:putative ABC transport system permease protein